MKFNTVLSDLFNCDFLFSKALYLTTSCSAVLRAMSCYRFSLGINYHAQV